MEEVCQRFPLIAQKILNQVDNKTLINYKEAGRIYAAFLEKERFYWTTIIQRYNCLIGEFHDVWKKVVKQTPIEIIKELAVAVHQFPQRMFFSLKPKQFYETISYLDFVQTIEQHWHPLFVAAACGSVNLCSHIIQKSGVKHLSLLARAPYSSRRLLDQKVTPLVFAAMISEDVNVFKILLEKAEDKNPMLRQYSNWTLLHDLANKGSSEMCRLMVDKMGDRNPQDIHGQTPYLFIASTGDVELCQILMEDLTDKNPKDHIGQTPLHAAACNGHVELCQILMENLMDKNPKDHRGQTPLHRSAWNGHVELCRILMENLMEKNPKDHSGQTPLHMSAWNGHVEVCQILIEDLIDKNPQDNKGQTPYHIAASIGHLELCHIVMENLKDKNPKDHSGKTPFYIAASDGHLEVCRLFMETCLDKNQDCVRAPLHVASLNGHVEVVDLLMSNIVDKNLKDDEGQNTPLLSAIQGGHLTVCKLLIEEYKVDVNFSNDYGMTPLHLSSQLGQLDIFKFLYNCASDKNAFDNYGRTPFDVAVSEGKWNIVEFIEGHGQVLRHFTVNFEDKNLICNTYKPLREEYEEICTNLSM